MSTNKVHKEQGIECVDEVLGVGVFVEGYDGDAVVTYLVCLGLLADELLACGAAGLHPAGAVAPTDG